MLRPGPALVTLLALPACAAPAALAPGAAPLPQEAFPLALDGDALASAPSWIARCGHLLDGARATLDLRREALRYRDLIKLLCIDEQLGQMVFRLDRIAERGAALDSGAAEPRAALEAIRRACAEVHELARRAASCIGEQLFQAQRARPEPITRRGRRSPDGRRSAGRR